MARCLAPRALSSASASMAAFGSRLDRAYSAMAPLPGQPPLPPSSPRSPGGPVATLSLSAFGVPSRVSGVPAFSQPASSVPARKFIGPPHPLVAGMSVGDLLKMGPLPCAPPLPRPARRGRAARRSSANSASDMSGSSDSEGAVSRRPSVDARAGSPHPVVPCESPSSVVLSAASPSFVPACARVDTHMSSPPPCPGDRAGATPAGQRILFNAMAVNVPARLLASL